MKGILVNKGKIVFVEENFWGRMLVVVLLLFDLDCYGEYGFFMLGFEFILYNDFVVLEVSVVIIIRY